jgi:hypothetical protein
MDKIHKHGDHGYFLKISYFLCVMTVDYVVERRSLRHFSLCVESGVPDTLTRAHEVNWLVQ